MTRNKRPFTKRQCESCGALLSETKHPGKYVCEYCGSVYFTDAYNENSWEGIQENHTIDQSNTIFPEDDHTRESGKNKKMVITVFFVCLAICFVIYLFSSRRGGGRTDTVESITVNLPSMLGSQPSAQKAGISIAYKNWEILVDPQYEIHNNRIFIRFSMQNWNDSVEVLTYICKDIIVYDDLGNQYPIYIGNCDIDIPYLDRSITFEPYEKITFSSKETWCNNEDTLPAFSGIIPLDANYLYVHFNKFEVFENITFIIEL